VGTSLNAGDRLAGRYVLSDLLSESGEGRFWRAHDLVLGRDVAVHVIRRDSDRAEPLMEAARTVAPLHDARMLRVLDADLREDLCYVVNEWGTGQSLDDMLIGDGPMSPRRSAWIVAEVADSLAVAHAAGLAHGRLVPENVMIDQIGQVRIIGFAVEAALHGLPPGRQQVDLTDLGALLYACLTGKWAGITPSLLPPAPAGHGSVLRPRRVRAGVPRVLDGLCEELLNPLAPSRTTGSRHDVTTARGIADLLHEFVGDAGQVLPVPQVPAHPPAQPPGPALTGPWPEPEPYEPPARPPLAASPQPTHEPTAEPVTEVTPTEPQPEAEPAAAPAPEKLSEPAAEQPAESAPTDVPTEAGLPLFDDDNDEVTWLRARSEPPAPPPELAPQAERPLFAPDPPEGQPVRRPRPGVVVPQQQFWPWEEPGDPTTTGSGRRRDDTHTGTSTHAEVPGRNWFRLGLFIGIALLVLLGALMAYQLGKGPGGNDDPDDGRPGTQQRTQGAPQAFTDVRGEDFDPQGTPPEEYPELVPLALDGKVETAWNTQTYNENFGPGGLKDGVGLLLTLSAAEIVREVDVTTEGGPTTFEVYVSEEPITSLDGLEPVGRGEGAGTVEVGLPDDTGGRYVLVWLTSIPQVSDGFRGTVAEVEVKG
ncbi:MAG: protein kinase family protein, partial [Nocardioides sp.]|uniref:protein kinase family protein n=1 Tax=Nocardioides sp. TaxID=35761 RepID=UPI003F11DCDC